MVIPPAEGPYMEDDGVCNQVFLVLCPLALTLCGAVTMNKLSLFLLLLSSVYLHVSLVCVLESFFCVIVFMHLSER